MKNISVLGSTGSIGVQTLEICRKSANLNVTGLTCNNNTTLLKKQINEFQPDYYWANKNIKIKNSKLNSPINIATDPDLDILVVATEGLSSLEPILKSLEKSKTIALANKESILCGADLIFEKLNKYSGRLIPLDSEPASVKGILSQVNKNAKKIIITASGGPFRGTKFKMLKNITPENALNHPTWKMGKKITIDSATLMNKAFEVIECSILFNFPVDDIEVILNPTSNIHALVEFDDNSFIAASYPPDMKIPINEGLNYSNFKNDKIYKKFEKENLNGLDFEPFNPSDYPVYEIGLKYGKKRGSWLVALCGADQAAVELFLNNKIKFTDIPILIESVLEAHKEVTDLNINKINEIYQNTINNTYDLAKV